MKPTKLISTNYVPWIIIILAIILLYAAYFLIYIPQQESRVERRAFRILKEYAGNINDKYDYYEAHLQNYGSFYVLRGVDLDKCSSVEQTSEKSSIVELRDQFNDIVDGLEKSIRVEFVGSDSANALHKVNLNISADEILFTGNITEMVDSSLSMLRYNCDSCKPEKLFNDLRTIKNISFPSGNPEQSDKEQAQKSNNNKGNKNSVAKSEDIEILNFTKLLKQYDPVYLLPMKTLMDGLKFDRLLNNIVLFDSTGALYNSNSELVFDITSPKALLDTLQKTQGGLVQPLEIRGEENHVLILPFELRNQRFYLAGFITETAFYDKTRAVNNQLLLILSGLLLLVLISMPAIKLFLINKKEILHARDATLATISLIAGLGFFLLIIIAVSKYYIIDRQNLEERLELASNTLYNNVQGDFDTIKNIYRDVIEHSAENDSMVKKKAEKVLAEVLIETRSVTTFIASMKSNLKTIKSLEKEFFTMNIVSVLENESDDRTDLFKDLPDKHASLFFPLNEVFLIDSGGVMKKAVSSTGANGLVPTKLNKRNYYRYLTADEINRSWVLKGKDWDDSGQHYYIESIKSYNSGKLEAAFSFKLPQDNDTVFDAPYMAITSHVPSLYKQVLPKDMSFLIIDEYGEVLFHSVHSKNLHENFLTECDENSRLEGAITHRVADIMEIRYNEKNWLARVKPMKDAPLCHITLIDLQYTQDNNARILLFTFYFMAATFLLIILGMQILKIGRIKRFEAASPWYYKWLAFDESKYNAYRFLLIIQSVIFLFQLLGLLINDKPVTMFLYQLVFIVFSVISAMVILRQLQWFSLKKIEAKNIPFLIFLLMLVILCITILIFFRKLAIPLALIIIPVMVIWINRFKANESGQFNRVSENQDHNQKSNNDDDKNNQNNLNRNKLLTRISGIQGRRVYQTYMFLWLLGLSCVPALQYYHSIKNQENELWARENIEHMAIKNHELRAYYENKKIKNFSDALWYEKIRGNGIDFIEISDIKYVDFKAKIKEQSQQLAPEDWLYAQLPDPVMNYNSRMGLLRSKNFLDEWYRDGSYVKYYFKPGIWKSDKKLSFSNPNYSGLVTIEKADDFNLKPLQWIMYFILPIVGFILLAWIIHQYLAGVILNTRSGHWKKYEQPSWSKVLSGNASNRILLISLNEPYYLDQASGLFKQKLRTFRSSGRFRNYSAGDLPNMSEQSTEKIKQAGMVWITEMDKLIRKPEHLLQTIPVLNKIFREAKGTVVVSLPFEMDFADELFDEILNDAEKSDEKQTVANIRAARQQLLNLFKSFHKYTGSISPESIKDSADVESQKKSYSICSELGFADLWNNLTHLEKLVLYDLADDGMVNHKNRRLILRLQRKGLVNFVPEPQLFSEDFRNYLLTEVDQGEITGLERSIGKQGKWRNMRYLILLILIPLLGFVFIAQGTSIEKVIGIFTGALALFSGLMRLTGGFAARQAGDSST